LLVHTSSGHHTRHGLSAMRVLGLTLTQSTIKLKANFSHYNIEIKFNEAALRLHLHGRGFQSKRFHDLETASKAALHEPANFVLDRF